MCNLSTNETNLRGEEIIQHALRHVNKHHPSVTQVFYGRGGEWFYCGDSFEIVMFGKEIDISLLDDAANAVPTLPLAYAIDAICDCAESNSTYTSQGRVMCSWCDLPTPENEPGPMHCSTDATYTEQSSPEAIHALKTYKDKLNSFQNTVKQTYSDGDHSYITAIKETEDIGDSLFRFLMHELANSEGCEDQNTALNRLETAKRDIETAIEAVESL